MNDAILIINAGSSSLKFCVYQLGGRALARAEVRGQIEGLGASAHFIVKDAAGATLADDGLSHIEDAHAALDVLTAWLRARYRGDGRIRGVGHRVVHGGAKYTAPTRVTLQVLADLRALVPLAPLHQPHNLDAIDAVAAQLPDAPQVACFDTSFHRGQPAVAEVVPLPRELCTDGMQRYGFHGLSYEYIASVLPERAPEIANRRVIVAHLGNGASLCALANGKSIDSTFGFTALDGLCMGTRPGALDPGVVLYLFQHLRLSAAEVESILYRKSGLLGISGISNDMRELLRRREPAARLAIDYFVYRATKEIGALAAVLGGIDALVFTAGIGENSAQIRERICEASAWLGVDLDHAANAESRPRITKGASRVSAWVIPTDEELMIARHTAGLLAL